MVIIATIHLAGSAVRAQTPGESPADPCAVPESLVMDDSALSRASARLARGEPFRIIVVGSGSSSGLGTSSPAMAYPTRLEGELRHRLGRADVTVTTLAQLGLTATDMITLFDREVIARRPVLVVWQTGTVEARRAVPLRDFGAALTEGIARLHAKEIDVVLMDMQFSPKLSKLVDYDTYQDFMQQVSDRADVILLRRYDMMQHWNETGAIPLEPEDKPSQVQSADRIHACVARHLARMIFDGLRPSAPPAGK